MSNETTDLVKVTPQAAVAEFSAFGNITHFENAQRMAKALCSSSIVPPAYQGEQNIGNCVIALEISNRIGASVLAVCQNLYVVHGKPGWSSQFLISCVNASQKFTPLRYRMTGEKGKDSWGCIAWAQDRGGEKLESPEVTVDIAKREGWYNKNGSKWQTMPELMLRYRAATLFARLYAPELTMGIQTAEELGDILDVESTVTSPEPAKPAFSKKTKAPEPVVVVADPIPGKPQEPKPSPRKEPEPKQPEKQPEPAPGSEAAQAQPVATPGVSPALQDLAAAMQESEVTQEQLLAFAAKKGALKEGADNDLCTLEDIIESKVPILAKMIRTKGQAWKEMKG